MAKTAGSIRQDGPDRWLVRIYQGRAESGKRVYISRAIRGTRRDAEKALREMAALRDEGRLIRPQRQTVADFLKQWLETAAAARTSGRTMTFYREQVDRYIAPNLGHVRLDKLRPAAVQRWVNGLLEQGLSPRTVRAAFGALHTALRRAVKWGLVAADPSSPGLVELPRARRAREVRVLQAEGLRAILEAARGERLEAFFALAVTGGLRPGELAGLRWRDIDFEAGTVAVRRTMTLDADGRAIYAPPKTARGERVVALPAPVVELLKAHRRRQLEESLASGRGGGLSETVFTNSAGRPMTPTDLKNVRVRDLRRVARKAFVPEHVGRCPECTMARWLCASRKLCAEGRKALADVHKLTLYSLRHSSASVLIATGANPKAVSERLGHASEAFTLATYVKSRADAQREAADRLGAALFAGEGSA